MITFHFEGHDDWIDRYSGPDHYPPVLGERFFYPGDFDVMVTEISLDKTEAWVEKYNKKECEKLRNKQ